MPFSTISPLFDATALAAVVAFLLSTIKPFVELLPFARVGTSTHDAALRLLNVLLNIVIVYLVAASVGQLTGATWGALILQGLAQAAGSQTLYVTITRSGGSVGDGPLKLLHGITGKLASPSPSPAAAPDPLTTDGA